MRALFKIWRKQYLMTLTWRDRTFVHGRPTMYGRVFRAIKWAKYLTIHTKGSWKPKLSRWKTKKPVVKLVSPVTQVMEMAKSEIKRQCHTLKAEERFINHKTETSYVSETVSNYGLDLFINIMTIATATPSPNSIYVD